MLHNPFEITKDNVAMVVDVKITHNQWPSWVYQPLRFRLIDVKINLDHVVSNYYTAKKNDNHTESHTDFYLCQVVEKDQISRKISIDGMKEDHVNVLMFCKVDWFTDVENHFSYWLNNHRINPTKDDLIY